jgi:ribosomal protein S18 acetylase RimI-like enzyme
MYATRPATVEDAGTIAEHRHRMFVDAGRPDNANLRALSESFKGWVTEQLRNGKYLGWLTESNGKVVAGAGLMLLDWPPHPLDPQALRGYLLNVYVDPGHRRKHLASDLIETALAEARRRKIRVVALHSTDAARPMYEANGFRRTDEMFYVEDFSG